MNSKKWVKSIQTAGYNGARKVNGTFVLFGNILLKKDSEPLLYSRMAWDPARLSVVPTPIVIVAN